MGFKEEECPEDVKILMNKGWFFEKKVIATNCVDRPEGVIVYGENTDKNLTSAINSIINSVKVNSIYKPENVAINLVKIYTNSNIQ